MTPAASDTRRAPGARTRPAWTPWPGGRTPRGQRRLVLGVLVLALVGSPRWVRLNVSPSLPYGLYRLTAVPTPLPRGALVVLPVPVSVQPWQTAWPPLLKPVAAVAYWGGLLGLEGPLARGAAALASTQGCPAERKD